MSSALHEYQPSAYEPGRMHHGVHIMPFSGHQTCNAQAYRYAHGTLIMLVAMRAQGIAPNPRQGL